jgi:hypothetical protein
MTKTYIDYDAKVQEALRQVVSNVLTETAEDGLQGDHHFYVAFKTQAEGVDIPAHLISRFPDEMTIVIQHKFWGLEVHPDRFEIGLSFNQKPEHLIIPFAAVVGFVDPSVQFALQFHDEKDEVEDIIEGDEHALADQEASMQDSDADPETDFEPELDEDSAEKAVGGDNIVTLDAFRRK